MKRLLIFTISILVVLTGFSQVTPVYPTKISTPTAFRHLMADSVIWIPYGATATLREPAATTRPGALFLVVTATDTTVQLWTGQRWVNIGGSTANRPTFSDGLIFGGSVTPLGGSDFFVQEAIYRIEGELYQTPDDTVTISASDPSLNRIDRVYLSTDNSGAHVLEGEPAVNALEPQVQSDEIGLAFISIPAGSAEPFISTQFVYNDNAGESTVTNLGTTTDPNSTVLPYGGSTKAVLVTNINDPAGATTDAIYFDKTVGSWNTLGFTGLSYAIKLNAAMPGSGNLGIQFFANGVAVSGEAIMPVNKTNITTYQLITSSAAAFGNITNNSVTRVRIRYIRGSSTATYAGFYIDNIFVVGGVSQQPVGNVSITQIPPTGFTLSPQNTITNTGTWTWQVSGGVPGQYLSTTGWANFPDFITTIGTLDGRSRVADGAVIDGDELFLQTVNADEPGLMTSEMFLKLDSNYYITNIGDGDTLAVAVAQNITGIKSLIAGTNTSFDVTDSTITINNSAGGGSTLFPLTGTGTASGNVTGELGGNTLTIESGVNPLATFAGGSTTIYGGQVGGAGSFLYMDGTSLQLAVDNGALFSSFFVIPDGSVATSGIETDTLHFIFSQYIPTLDTTSWKPLIISSTGRVATSHWSDMGGGGGGEDLDATMAIGSTLTTNRTIAAGGNSLAITGSDLPLNVTGSNAILAAVRGTNSSSGIGLEGVSNSGIGISGVSTSGTAISSQTNSGLGLDLIINPSSTNTVATIGRLTRSTSSTAANSIGGALDFFIENDGGTSILAGRLITQYSDVTAGSEDSHIDVTNLINGTPNTTTISPHNFTGIPGGRSEELAWSFYSERDGKYINVDMLKLVRLVEHLSGEKLVYIGSTSEKPNLKNK